MTILVGKPLTWAITATAGSGFLLYVAAHVAVALTLGISSNGVYSFGYDQGVMSGLLSGDAFTRTFPEIDTTPDGNGSSSLQGTVYVHHLYFSSDIY